MGKRLQPPIDLPEGWWDRLTRLCQELIVSPESTQRQITNLEIYERTVVSRRAFSSAKHNNQMKKPLFRRMAGKLGYVNHEDLLRYLAEDEPCSTEAWNAPDLRPPPADYDVPRPRCRRTLQALAASYLAVIIQGPRNSGKSALTRDLVGQAGGTAQAAHLLWCSLLPGDLVGDLLERLKLLEGPLTTTPGQEVANLISWLHSEDVVLVLDGLEEGNVHSFGPLLQRCSNLPGPARIIATSEVRLTGKNTYNVPTLSAEELCQLAAHYGAVLAEADARVLITQTDIWPYAIEKAVALFGTVDSSALAQTSTIHAGELLSRLTAMDRRVVEVLRSVAGDFDLRCLSEVLAAVGCHETSDAVANRLQSLFLLRQVSALDWRLDRICLPEPTTVPVGAELGDLLERLSRHYEARVFQPDRLPVPFALDELTDLYKACRLLQLANRNPMHRDWLLQRISRGMESLGLHDRLLVLYGFETKAAGQVVGWTHFKYARSLHVTGRLQAVLKVCDDAFHYLTHPSRRKGRDENLYVSFLRLLAQLLIDVSLGAVALQILDAALETAEIAELSSTVGVQTVGTLGWGLIRTGMTREYDDLNKRVLRRPFGDLINPFQQALSKIYAGVALIAEGDSDAAVLELEAASEFFSSLDIRAYSWSTLHLAEAYRGVGRPAEAGRALYRCIETNAQRNLLGPDLARLCDEFLASTEYEELRPTLRLELDRSRSYEAERAALTLSLPDSRLIEHILLEHAIEPNSEYNFDSGKYELFSEVRPYPIKSRFNQDLIRRLRKGNAEEVLNVLFEERTPHDVFRIHIYNRVIVNACKDAPILAKKFVYPHLGDISTQVDGVLFVYARYFEGVGTDVPTAQRLLERVRHVNCFNYYNIAANCMARTDFTEAMRLNEVALSFARARQQKAQIQYNMASLIFSHRQRGRFLEAIDLCEASVRNTKKVNFHWPKNLMLKLQLVRSAADEDIERVLDKHRQRFNVPIETLRRVCSELDPGQVRRVSLVALEKLRQA